MSQQMDFADLCNTGNIYEQHLARFRKFKERTHKFVTDKETSVPSLSFVESEDEDEFCLRFAGDLYAIRLVFKGRTNRGSTISHWVSYRVDKFVALENQYQKFGMVTVDGLGNAVEGVPQADGYYSWEVGENGFEIMYALLKPANQGAKVVKLAH